MTGLLDFFDGDNNPLSGGLLGGLAPQGAPPAPDAAFADPYANQAGGVLGPAGQWLGNNSDLLIALGAGLASGKDWGDGLGKAGMLALRARQGNPQQRQLRQQQQAQLALARLLMAGGAGRSLPPSVPGVPTR